MYGDNWENLDAITLEAYIGILWLAGVYRSHGESTKSLWNPERGRPIFSVTMSLKTFYCISRVLRFDKSDRRARRAYDKLEHKRDFWEHWEKIISKFYNPGTNVTVDEQLVGFRGLFHSSNISQVNPQSTGSKYGLCVIVLVHNVTTKHQ